jgi:hypothetical protein
MASPTKVRFRDEKYLVEIRKNNTCNFGRWPAFALELAEGSHHRGHSTYGGCFEASARATKLILGVCPWTDRFTR